MSLLSDSVVQFSQRHGRRPEIVYVTPLAALTLIVKNQFPRYASTTRVVVADFTTDHACTHGERARFVGIFVKNWALTAVDLWKDPHGGPPVVMNPAVA